MDAKLNCQIKPRNFSKRLQEDSRKVLLPLCSYDRRMWCGVLVDAVTLPLAWIPKAR